MKPVLRISSVHVNRTNLQFTGILFIFTNEILYWTLQYLCDGLDCIMWFNQFIWLRESPNFLRPLFKLAVSPKNMLRSYMQLKKLKTKKIWRQKSSFLFYWDLARKILLRTEYMEIPCPKGYLSELGNLLPFTVFIQSSRG